MADKEKDLYYLDDLSGYKVADDYPDVRGWFVRDANNQSIGKVDGLLVSKQAERVVYLDVEVDDSVIKAGHEPYENPASKGIHEFVNRDGEDHLILPIGLVTLDEETETVRSDQINHKTFAGTKRFRKGADIDRTYESLVVTGYIPDDTGYQGDNFYNGPAFRRNRI